MTITATRKAAAAATASKPSFVCGFEIGDLVEIRRPLIPHSKKGPSIPRFSVGVITALTANTARVSFLFWDVRWLDKDDLQFPMAGIPAPEHLAKTREGDAR